MITNYRGYQTMDSRDHPDVTRGQKANDLISEVSSGLFWCQGVYFILFKVKFRFKNGV